MVIIAWMFNGLNGILDKEQAAAEIEKTVHRIRAVSPGTRVLVVGPVPHWNKTLKDVLIKYAAEHQGALPPSVTSYGLQEDPGKWDLFLKDKFVKLGIDYVSPLDYLCDASGCLTRTGENPKDLTTIDSGHLTDNGSEVLMERMKGEIERRLR